MTEGRQGSGAAERPVEGRAFVGGLRDGERDPVAPDGYP